MNLDQEFLSDLFAQIELLTENTRVESPFTAKKLATTAEELLEGRNHSDTKITQWNIFELLKKGILTPFDRGRTRKPRYDFTKDDLRRVLAISLLREYNFSVEEAAEVTKNKFCVDSSQLSKPTNISDISRERVIRGTTIRARLYIWTRSLQHVLSIFFDTILVNTVIIVDKIDRRIIDGIEEVTEFGPAWGSYSKTPKRQIAVLDQAQFPFLKLEYEVANDSYLPKPTVIAVGDPASSYSYKLTIIWPYDSKQKFTQNGLRILRQQPSRQVKCIYSLLALMFEEFEMPPQPTTLDAVAVAITQAIPGIETCCILLPSHDPNRPKQLTVQAKSGSIDSKDLPKQVTSGRMFLGWVYKHGLPLYIEQREFNDWRTPDLDGSSWTTVAAIPTLEAPGQAVVFVGSHRNAEDQEIIFTRLTRDLLSVLAGIVGIIIVSEHSEEKNMRKRTEQLCSQPFFLGNLSEHLQAASEVFFQNPPLELDRTEQQAIVTIAILIDNLEEIEKHCGPVYVAWLEERILTLANYQSLKTRESAVSLCKLAPGKFAMIFEQTTRPESEFKELSMQLSHFWDRFTFESADRMLSIRVYTWVLYFPYSYLRRKIRTRHAKSLINLITQRTESALQNLARIQQGNLKLEEGDFEGAINLFESAIQKDSNNPYLYKHLGEARLHNQKYESAINALDKALELDSQYAGAHYLKAEALAVMGQHREAVKEYEAAIEIKPIARYHWLFGIELFQNGQFAAAAAQFRQAKELDPRETAEYDLMIGLVYLREERYEDAYFRFATLDTTKESSVLGQLFLKEARQSMLRIKNDTESDND